MNTGRFISSEARHCLDTFPIRDRHELGLVRAVLPEGLNPHRFLDQGFDADLVTISLIFVRTMSLGATAPDAGNCWALRVVPHRNLRHATCATVARSPDERSEIRDIASLIRATDTVSNLKGEAAAPRTTRREPCYREVMASSRRSTDLPRPGDKNANLDKICAFRCDCSWHRRYGIGCDQEPENCSASERPIHSGCRSAHRPVFQSVRSGSHRRR